MPPMLYKSTPESLEETSLIIHQTMTNLKELDHKAQQYEKKTAKQLNSSKYVDAKKTLKKMCKVEKQIEHELKQLLNALDFHEDSIKEDILDFKEMVYKAAIKNKLSSISYFIDKEINNRTSQINENDVEKEVSFDEE